MGILGAQTVRWTVCGAKAGAGAPVGPQGRALPGQGFEPPQLHHLPRRFTAAGNLLQENSKWAFWGRRQSGGTLTVLAGTVEGRFSGSRAGCTRLWASVPVPDAGTVPARNETDGRSLPGLRPTAQRVALSEGDATRIAAWQRHAHRLFRSRTCTGNVREERL